MGSNQTSCRSGRDQGARGQGRSPHLVGVGPEQVAEQALVGHVGGPRDPPDLLHALQVGREAAVAAEDLLVHDGRHRQAIEAVGERLP